MNQLKLEKFLFYSDDNVGMILNFLFFENLPRNKNNKKSKIYFLLNSIFQLRSCSISLTCFGKIFEYIKFELCLTRMEMSKNKMSKNKMSKSEMSKINFI